MRTLLKAVAFACVLSLYSCSDLIDITPIDDVPWWNDTAFATTDVTVAAGLAELQPVGNDTLSSSVNLSRFKVSKFDRVYELQTPAGTDFAFNIVARGEGNFGLTRISVGHVENGGSTVDMGVQSIAGAGMTVEAPGLSNRGTVVDVNGDGFARVTIRGNITSEQVLIARVPRLNDTLDIGIRISIGSQSDINLIGGNTQGTRPGMTWNDVYSSNSWQFGLPSIAVSGDRYSLVAYDGDPTTPDYVERRRRWLQLDTTTSVVTGGSAQSESPDSGFWRDQEVAALGNVLAVAYTGCGQVRAEVSLNRGASFPHETIIDPYSSGSRLVQIAIASDYRLGVLFWRTRYQNYYATSELALVEAIPTGFDSNNTPTGYFWGQTNVVHAPNTDVTPLLMHMEYSQGGDLVVGYGYTRMDFNGGNLVSSSRFRCAVRPQGSYYFSDKEIDREDNSMPCDPHVSLLGSGATMEIFYAYERANGVHLWYSSNAGQTYQRVAHVQVPGAMMPSVHARMQGADKRVDLLYVAPDGWGLAVQNLHWDNFTTGATGEFFSVTQSAATPGGNPPPGMSQGFLITTLAWFGYDAVIVGDDVAVVIHEITYDSYEYYYASGWNWDAPVAGGAGATSGSGSSSTPPPQVLLPGLTDPVPAPDPAHRNKLRVAVLD
jgi:hypothetical protein